jgi:2-keto-3-deoxy-L-rhamnonate aldolase RhmA
LKAAALAHFRSKLRADEPVYGLRVTLEPAAVTEISAGFGFDWVLIDAAHGDLDWREIHEHLRATIRSETVALVRLDRADQDSISRALNLGADGVVIPGVETAGALQSLMSASHESSLIIPTIDTTHDARLLQELATVNGTDIFFFELEAASDDAVSYLRGRGKHACIIAAAESDLASYRDRGFRMLGVGVDADIISAGIHEMIEIIRKSARQGARE